MEYKIIVVASIFICFDIITGVLSALYTGTFKSGEMRRGGVHKLFLLVVIAFGCALDYAQTLVDLGFNLPCLNAICGYISLMEIMSNIENINKAFPDALPKSITNMLQSVARDHEVEIEGKE